jgi:RNA polymerase sigma factor (sigma-70 family)
MHATILQHRGRRCVDVQNVKGPCIVVPFPRHALVRGPQSDGRWEEAFLSALPTIRRLTSRIARQHRLSPCDSEDFAAEVQLHIIADNYAVLRKFAGRSTLTRFLAIVIQRLLRDYCDARWGKWRPSVRTRREGALAIVFERLVVRDGLGFDEARTVLDTNLRLPADDGTLERIYGRLRRRSRPRLVGEAEIGDQPAVGATADALVDERDRRRVLSEATTALRHAVTACSPQDRLLLKLHFRDGLTIAAIGRMLGIDQKRLYRRLGRLLGQLRSNLEAAGLVASEVLPAIGRNDVCPAGIFSGEVRGCDRTMRDSALFPVEFRHACNQNALSANTSRLHQLS